MSRKLILSSIVLCGLLCFIVPIKADSSMWSRTYGGTGLEEGCLVVGTSDGGYAIAGHTYSFGAGGFDFWLIKTDEFGYMEWNQTYEGAIALLVREVKIACSLVATSDGGYAIGGYTESFGAGISDFWLIKTDENGVVPEYSSWLLPSILMVATLVIVVYKKNYSSHVHTNAK